MLASANCWHGWCVKGSSSQCSLLYRRKVSNIVKNMNNINKRLKRLQVSAIPPTITSSHYHILPPTVTSSHCHILPLSHPSTVTSSHCHILPLTSSHCHILPLSHPPTVTSFHCHSRRASKLKDARRAHDDQKKKDLERRMREEQLLDAKPAGK